MQLLVKVLQNIETYAILTSTVSSDPLFTIRQTRKHQEIQKNTDKQNSRTSTESPRIKEYCIPTSKRNMNSTLLIYCLFKMSFKSVLKPFRGNHENPDG